MSALLELARQEAGLDLDARFAQDVLAGLAQRRKSIPCTWLYDRRGSELFERITGLQAYYPSRTESAILARCAGAIAQEAGPGAVVVELGSGASRKTELLLDALARPAAYLPLDVSGEALTEAAARLRTRLPLLRVEPRHVDFTQLDQLPRIARSGRTLVFFPGSTVGNFEPDAAVALLARIGRAAGPGSLLVVGADHTRDPELLLPAYDDPAGVTAAFNQNLLVRINRELDGHFSRSAFRHQARWVPEAQRIEMHLVSQYTQRVSVLGREFTFAMGESIHTESSHKHGLLRFQALMQRAGWTQRQLWMDASARFAVHVLERMPAA